MHPSLLTELGAKSCYRYPKWRVSFDPEVFMYMVLNDFRKNHGEALRDSES